MFRRFSLIALISSLAWASPAAALSVTPDPLAFDFSGLLVGELDFVGMTTGVPAWGTVLDGSVAATDITLTFTLSVSSSSIGGIPFVLFEDIGLPTVTGAGTVAGPDDDVASAIVVPTSASIAFDAIDGIDAGQTSDVFFVSYSSLPVGTTLDFTIAVLSPLELEIVPEPGTALLVGVGMVCLGARRRRRAAPMPV